MEEEEEEDDGGGGKGVGAREERWMIGLDASFSQLPSPAFLGRVRQSRVEEKEGSKRGGIRVTLI